MTFRMHISAKAPFDSGRSNPPVANVMIKRLGRALLTALILLTVAPLSLASEARSKVFVTKDISSNGLMAAYEALEREPFGAVAVKVSTGEAGNPHYLSPLLIEDLVQSV